MQWSPDNSGQESFYTDAWAIWAKERLGILADSEDLTHEDYFWVSLSKRYSRATILLRTLLTRTISSHVGMLLQGSNHSVSILCLPTCCNQLNLVLIRGLLEFLGCFWAISNYFPLIIPGHPTFATVGQKVSQSTIKKFINKAANLLRIWK